MFRVELQRTSESLPSGLALLLMELAQISAGRARKGREVLLYTYVLDLRVGNLLK